MTLYVPISVAPSFVGGKESNISLYLLVSRKVYIFVLFAILK